MKIVCVCDLTINSRVMAKMSELEKYGNEVVMFKDEQMQTPDEIVKAMIKAEQEGADSLPANPAVVEACKDADVIVAHVTVINTEVIENARNLKWVAVLRSGVENVNTELCKEKGIKVISAPGRSAHAVADLTVGMMIAESRNIARGHMDLMNGKWTKDFPNTLNIHDMRKCTVGIIGAGQIGLKVAERLKGFGPRILVHDPYVSQDMLRELGLEPVSKEELLRNSDFITIHLRLTPDTEKLIGREEIGMMKEGAYFINCARAGLVDEEALIEALDNYDIGGAAIDVFSEEPLTADSPYLKLENVTLTPHIAGTSMDTFDNSVEIIHDALTDMFEGRPVPGLIC